MICVLALAESSLLADLIVLSLAREPDLEVLQLTQPEQSRISEVIRQDCSVLIIVEDGKSKDTFSSAKDLGGDHGCLRTIKISPRKHHLLICDSYEIPISGMAQVVELARDLSRESSSVAG